MAVSKQDQQDVAVILSKRHENGSDHWATPDGRWGVGSPFATLDCILMLHELGMPKSDPILKGAAACILDMATEDGRFRPTPKGAIYPCHTANAARVLCRLGYAKDKRLQRTFDYLFDIQHDDGGWRCNTVKLGRSEVTDASNPGVTLNVLDAFRFTPLVNQDRRLDKAVRSLIAHWKTRVPLGPCSFGIGSRFMQVEYPFFRYNLFSYVYVLSFFRAAGRTKAFKDALGILQSKLVTDNRLVGGQVVVEHTNRGLAALAFCKKGQPSRLATKRFREILKNVSGGPQ